MILRRTDRQGASVLAGKLRTALMEQPAIVGAGEQIPVRVCIGVSVYPDDANSAADLARLSDQALYRAKAGGRDRVEFTTEYRSPTA